MADPARFYVRPVYYGTDLLVEIVDDHRVEGFPDVAGILRDALGAQRVAHPQGMDTADVALLHDRFFSYWRYPGGAYEIDADIWALFVAAPVDNAAVIADVERALSASGLFAKKDVDFAKYR